MANDVMVCIPCDPAARMNLPYIPGPGYSVTKCQACKQDMWLGPRQKTKVTADTDIPVLCMVCAVNIFGPTRLINIKTLNKGTNDVAE